jgi:hypothetical protein
MRHASLLALCVLLPAAPAQAQMFNFPDYSIRSGAPATVIATHLARGLSASSGKRNAYGATVSRSGIAERFSARVGIGMVDRDPEGKLTFGGAVQASFTDPSSSTALALLAGFGYMSIDPATLLRFPIGVSAGISVPAASGSTVFSWVMPRLDISRLSASGTSGTETNLGASGGVTVLAGSGLGFHLALDLVASDPTAWHTGGGIQYVIQ